MAPVALPAIGSALQVLWGWAAPVLGGAFWALRLGLFAVGVSIAWRLIILEQGNPPAKRSVASKVGGGAGRLLRGDGKPLALSQAPLHLACLPQQGKHASAGLTSSALQEHDASGSCSAGNKAARRSRTSPAVSELSESIQLEDW